MNPTERFHATARFAKALEERRDGSFARLLAVYVLGFDYESCPLDWGHFTVPSELLSAYDAA